MRSLGAIFMADVVSYSKMMSFDEAGTLDALRARQSTHGRACRVLSAQRVESFLPTHRF